MWNSIVSNKLHRYEDENFVITQHDFDKIFIGFILNNFIIIIPHDIIYYHFLISIDYVCTIQRPVNFIVKYPNKVHFKFVDFVDYHNFDNFKLLMFKDPQCESTHNPLNSKLFPRHNIIFNNWIHFVWLLLNIENVIDSFNFQFIIPIKLLINLILPFSFKELLV